MENSLDSLKQIGIGLGGVTGIEAAEHIIPTTGSTVEAGVKVGFQILIGIVSPIGLIKHSRQNRKR